MNRMARPDIVTAWLLPLLLAIVTACSMSGPTTPAEGSPERDGILNAIRLGREIPDQKFEVRTLLMQDGWAWLTADPKSADGKQNYETESWLLQSTPYGWRVMAQPCQEADCVWKDEIGKMRAQFPLAPPSIFPE